MNAITLSNVQLLPARPVVSAPAAPARPLPAPRRGQIQVRAATLADLPFIDSLQKRTTKQVGWMPTGQLEGKIRLGEVLIAERHEGTEARRHEGNGGVRPEAAPAPSMASLESKIAQAGSASAPFVPSCLRASVPLGYLIGNDRYLKRDDLGIIYQVNVIESERRGLVAATLLKAQFDRSAWGCKLYCCWCAQDLEANRFWEAMGFVPIAFRTGSATRGRKRSDEATKRRSDEGRGSEEVSPGSGPSVASSLRRSVATGRIHIFWQKRIRGNDRTPWWYPCATSSGAVRGDRLVLPIPIGVHWSDEMPVILPEIERDEETEGAREGPRPRGPSEEGTRGIENGALVAMPAGSTSGVSSRAKKKTPPPPPPPVRQGFSEAGLARIERARVEHLVSLGQLPMSALHEALAKERALMAAKKNPPPPQPVKKPTPAKKVDPRHVAMSRELRDRWLEEIAPDPSLILPRPRYEVTRQLPEPEKRLAVEPAEKRALPAAA